jgi:hypothetical protein
MRRGHVKRNPKIGSDAQHDRQLRGELQRAAHDRSPRQQHRKPREFRAGAPHQQRRDHRGVPHHGAAYDSMNLWWLLSTPRHHAAMTSRPATGEQDAL